MKRVVPLLLIAFSGCSDFENADTREQGRQETLQSEAFRQTGSPAITNFTERKFLKHIYELRDSNVRTWIYKLDLRGHHHLVGLGVGYPMPASAQYSNPQKYSGSFQYHVIMPQAEPNGVFMPASAEGSWVMIMTEKGPKVYYSEDRLTGSPVPIPNADESEAISK